MMVGKIEVVLNLTFFIHMESPWNSVPQKAIYPNAIGMEIC